MHARVLTINNSVLLFLLLACLMLLSPFRATAATCLWVSSYAPGYEWNDGIGKGIHSVLDGRCEISEFHMDTKRNKSHDFARKQALKAKTLISQLKPDVVIASDDNASKFLVAPHFKNLEIPFVVCGINWSVKEYGYPYSNVTGVVEIFPVNPLVRSVKEILSIGAGHGLLLVPDTRTAHKNFTHLKRHFSHSDFQLDALFANTFDEWKQGFLEGQSYDFMVLLNNSGIEGWNDAAARNHVITHGKQLSISFNRWMLPYSMVVFTKIPEEQGEWAGNMALAILEGSDPSQIPMTSNQRWNEYINTGLLKRSGIRLPRELQERAIREKP